MIGELLVGCWWRGGVSKACASCRGRKRVGRLKRGACGEEAVAPHSTSSVDANCLCPSEFVSLSVFVSVCLSVCVSASEAQTPVVSEAADYDTRAS